MRTTPTALLLLTTLLAVLHLPHLGVLATPSAPPSSDPQERLALALGQNAPQYVVTGVGAPAVAPLPPQGPALMDPLVRRRGGKGGRMERVGRGRRGEGEGLWERTEEEVIRGEKRATGGEGGWRKVERRRKGAKRLPKYREVEEESMR